MKKRTKWKKILALLCTGLLLTAIPACSGGTGGTGGSGGSGGNTAGTQVGAADKGAEPSAENAKGRFLETELALPEKISTVIGVRKCADNSIALIGYDENYAELFLERSVNQGADWEEISLNSDGPLADYAFAAIGEDGSAALFGYISGEDGLDILLAAPDGSARTLTLQLPEYRGSSDDTSNWILSAAWADEKLFVVDFNSVLYEADTASGELREASKSISEDIRDVLPLGKKLALVTSNGVRLMDAESGTLLAEDEELLSLLGTMERGTDTPVFPSMLTAGEEDEELYFATHSGIFYHRLGQSTTEQLANGELISIGDTSMSFRELARFDDGHFTVFAVDSLGTERCYSYVYDPDASAVPEKQLNVYALEDSEVLQQAISMYQKNNPDVFVKKTIGMSGDDSVTAEDAIKTLNTEIMAGNGPDVLVLDGLPAESYIEKGILSDISALAEDADQTDGLFTNITDAFRKDGRLYQIPLRFFCAAAEWDEGLPAIQGTPEQLARACEALPGSAPVLTPFSAEYILYAFYDAFSPSWRTETGIDAAALKESLAAVKKLYDMDGYAEDERISYYISFDSSMYHGQSVYGTLTGGSINRLMGNSQVSIGTLCGVDSVRELYGIESSRAGNFGLLCPGEQQIFVPFVCLGLAEAAKDTEIAQDFIRAALSADGQRQMTTHFSVNRKAHEKECQNDKTYSISTSGPDGQQVGYEVKPLEETQIQSLTAMLERLNTPMWSDRVVQDLVISEGKKYLLGEQSLEDTVSAVTQKVQLYVSE